MHFSVVSRIFVGSEFDLAAERQLPYSTFFVNWAPAKALIVALLFFFRDSFGIK